MREKEKINMIDKKKLGPSAISEKGNDLGLIKIHENVISSLVRKATCAVSGVTRLAGSTFVDNLAEIVGSRRISDRAITINIEEDTVEIEVKINVCFGVQIPEVAAAVQRAVIEKVEETTGMTVKQVNVIVQEIEEEQAAKDAEDDEHDEDDEHIQGAV